MDARSFGDFLVSKLSDLAKTIESNLLNSAYEKIEHSHKASGTLQVLKEITTKMDNLLTDFHESQNSDQEGKN
ncbi:MAG: hypothetical protein RLY40_67 [Pseudomonadota bacterium]|jgi:hypothetical protein